tara:strand:- start:3157 stop:3321 length:165 start_codon:yes stop_codon:yes gene_type:complete
MTSMLFGIDNLKHTCCVEGCDEKSTTKITQDKDSGFYCAVHSTRFLDRLKKKTG